MLRSVRTLQPRGTSAHCDRALTTLFHSTQNGLPLSGAILMLLATVLMAGARSQAQGIPQGMGPDNTGAPIANRAGVKIHLTVLDESKKPLKQQALIRLTNQDNGRVFFQTTNRSDTDFPDIPPGKYMAEVGAAGYV